MARRSLRPQLNQIRTWVRQGRTDAWIAHQLEATVQQISAFKAENDLTEGSTDETQAASPTGEVDLRAEDDALIAKELEAEAVRRAEEEAAAKEKAEAEAKAKAEAKAAAGDSDDDDDSDEAEAGSRRRRRGRRGGRGRRSSETTFEATFDHGEEGYGLWLDPAVADSAVYAEHWAGHRPIEVLVEADQIIIRRFEPGKATDASSDSVGASTGDA
ncbi:MAG: hypothetical protein JHD16_17200 [Solirubrobacteraceae bacterium]|nr:hypothetical protein [Solirubrobacteraceae bacterium]